MATNARRRLAAGAGGPSVAGGWKLLHTARRGRAKIMVFGAEDSRKSDGRYTLAVERRGSKCRDCMSCVNEAVEWMEDRGKSMRS
jgi:hypothetical protein